MKVTLQIGAVVLLASSIATTVHGQNDGPEWVEGSNGTGDAGGLPGGAQNTTGDGQMAGLRGGLGSPLQGEVDTEDMYWIFIDDPQNFRATTSIEFNGFSDFDSEIWLFQPGSIEGGGVQGFGLLANDEFDGLEEGASMLLQSSTDNSGAFVSERGWYLLAITRFDNNPFSDSGLIFNQASRFEISGPDGPGGNNPITGWTGEGGQEGGGGNIEYRIRLDGVTFANLPAPGALALLGLAGALGRRGRRS